tara:strand:+ start:501 stop:2069 length:1569 start_codon:yes stop_codon:yes gene_type:complete
MNERKLSKSELKKREDIIMNMKGNKRDLVKKYGKDAETVMYGRATNMAKKQTQEMRDPNLTELIKNALKNPSEKDLAEVELPKSIIQKLANEIKDPQGFAKAMLGIYNAIQDKEQKDYSKNQKFGRVLNYLNDIADDEKEEVSEDMDMNDPILVKLRADKMDREKLANTPKAKAPPKQKKNSYHIALLLAKREELLNDMEQEAEPEGGPIADEYGYMLNKIDKALAKLEGRKEMTYDQAVAEETGQLGTDDDTGFQASLYTPNELGDVSVGREYASGAFEENQKPINETMNMNKWRRAYNGKAFAKKIVYLEDYMGNKKRYAIYFKYKETPSKDVVFLKESHFGNHEGSGMPFAMSNLQNKPTYLFTSDDKMEFDTEEQFDDFVDDGAKGLESLLSFFLGGKNVDDAIKAWFDTGVTDKSKLRIGPAEYFEGAKVDESISKHSTIAEKLAKELKESLPKGYWDKKIDAKDEDQDGKVDESYNTLVNKIKKSGKSSKAAKAIAGAVASYKAKGGGKGPTAKQK